MNSWHSSMVSIWIKNFTETILALPISYSLNSKLYCLKSYGKTHVIFKLKTVIEYTIKGYYIPRDIIQYKAHFKSLMPLNWKIYYLVFRSPKYVLRLLMISYKITGKIKKIATNL